MEVRSLPSRAEVLPPFAPFRSPARLRLPGGGHLRAALLAVCVALPAPAFAETISIACEASPMFGSDAMELVYEGEAEGTLTISGTFGTMTLPATKEDREGTDEAGNPLSATGIRAFGPASVLMPEKSAVEACVRNKLPADQLADSDIVFMTTMSCTGETPVATEPVEIQASAEVAFVPEVYVGVTRTYAEPTDLVTGTIALETYPSCAVKE
jgi:hypothetical protein